MLVNPAGKGLLDNVVTDGLLGTPDSLAYRVEELERHFHNHERWIGLAGNLNTLAPCVIDSGDNTWGAWVEILPIGATPMFPNMTRFDMHRVLVTAAERTTPYRVMFLWKTAAQSDDDALNAYQFTEFLFAATTATFRSAIHDVLMPRLLAGGYSVQARCWNAGNTGTLAFFVGLHEYEG